MQLCVTRQTILIMKLGCFPLILDRFAILDGA